MDVSSKMSGEIADLDVTELELITPHVTTQLQVFNNQVVAHLKNYKPEIGRIYDRLGDLASTDERLEGFLKSLESDVVRNNDQALSNHNSLAERLTKVEQLLSALPSWKEDLVGRIDNLTRETRAKHDAASARTTVLEDSLNAHIQATRERLDMLTSVARTASEARAQQQERIDEMDTELRRLRENTERELNDHKLKLRRHDEQHVMANSKMSEHGGQLAGHKLELARLKDSSDQHNRQLENLARGLDKLHDVSAGLGQEVNLMKRGMANTDQNLATLEAKVLSSDAEAQSRLKTLEEHRNLLFQFRDETHATLERMDKSAELLNDRVQMLDIKVEAGPPGLWKMASQVSAHEDELNSTRIGLAAAKAMNEELTRRLEDVMSGLAHHRDVASQLREECRMLGDRLTAEATRAHQYVDDQLVPLARRYELEALRKNVDIGLQRLEAALAGSGERLKFELLHDEAAQVGTIREYLSEAERRNSDLVERVAQLEAGLAGEAERNRSIAAVTRELRGTLDGLLSTSQADLARLRATMTSLHEEYEEMSKKARRAGLLTVTQVEDIIDMRLNGPVLDSVIARKLSSMPMLPGGLPRGPGTGVALSFGRFTSGALRPGAAGPSWQPSSLQRQLSASAAGGGSGTIPASEMASPAATAAVSLSGAVPAAMYNGGEGTSPLLGTAPISGVVAMEQALADAAAEAAFSGGVVVLSGNAAAAAGGGAGGGAAGGAGAGGGGGLGGSGSSADVALGLRLVTVESDMSRLFEALRSLGNRVAPVSEVADLRQQLEDLTATVQHLRVGQGVLGEAGEEAVRRHVHLTMLPELLRRQSQDARRIMGWMDEQLADVTRELATLRQSHEKLRARTGETAPTASPAPPEAVAAATADAAAAGAAATRLSITWGQRPLAGRPVSASAALISPTSTAAAPGTLPPPLPYLGIAEVTAQTTKVQELAEQLKYLSEVLGVPLGHKAAQGGSDRALPSTGLKAAASNTVGSRSGAAGAAENLLPGPPDSVAADGEPRHHTSEALSAAPSVGGEDSTAGPVPLMVGEAITATAATAVMRPLSPPEPDTALDGMVLRLPALLERLQQLETAVHTIAAEQRALTVAAAATATAATIPAGITLDGQTSAAGIASEKRAAVSATAGSQPQSPVAAAAAVQGLVNAAVSELRLRLHLVEQELPQLARVFEVKALKRQLLETISRSVSSSAVVPSLSFSYDTRPAGLGSVSQLPLAKSRANGSGRGASFGAGAVPAVDPQLLKRLSSLELTVVTIDERGRALEERLSSFGNHPGSAGGGGGSKDAPELSRLQSTVTQLAKEVQRLAQSQSGGAVGAATGGGGGGGIGTWVRVGAGEEDAGGGGRGGRQLAPTSTPVSRGPVGGGGVAAVGASGVGSMSPVSLAEVVNVELSGIAHDLAVAAHEELQRTRDGPLPDGTQEGLPTPAAIANREAALARLRRKPLEVAAHVELLESVKLHLDRLMRRSTSCTTDRLVLLAAMSAMRIKLLENEAEAFREQIISVFRSLERAFTALVKLQEAIATKSSATAVGQLANMLQDISAGLATLAAHAALRDLAPLAARGSAAAAAIATAATAVVDQVRWRQPGSVTSTSVDGMLPPAAVAVAAAASSNSLSLPAPLAPGGSLDEALQMMASRGPSPPQNAMRPVSPVRLSGPGMNTAIHRQQAAAVRGGGGRHASSGGTPGPQQSWPGSRAVSSPVGAPIPTTISPTAVAAPSSPLVLRGSAGGGGAAAPGNNLGPLSVGVDSPTNSMPLPSAPHDNNHSPRHQGIGGVGASGAVPPPNRMWSSRRPASAVVNGLHVGVPPPGQQPAGGGPGGRHPGPGPQGPGGGPNLPSIGYPGLGTGRNGAGR